ncbi:MAG TPA: PBP1A family penicillin-binding protein, partial [Thermoanaerobaculia bacterium]|nr:PBP1A family penicillin-binding protein [Thermoanaerobaculia bacterium]
RRRRPLPGSGALRWAWPLLAALLLGAAGGVVFAAAIHVPRVESVVDFTPGLVTQLLDRHGKVFTTFARERRVMLREEEIPKVLAQAVLASEDSNFFRHGGVDAFGVARAALADLRAGEVVEGASTITMQLARSLFLSREQVWRRKIEEAFLAVELEKSFSKQQILTMYLNLMNFGHGNYGAEAASRYYFAKPAAQLTLAEAATLAGILPAPSRYSPYRRPEVVLRQRQRVLRRMLAEGMISRAAHDRAAARPLLVSRQQPQRAFAPYYAEDVRKYLEATYGADALYEGGLQVQTTIDPAIQASAEKAVREGLARLDHRRGWRGAVAELEGDPAKRTLPTWSGGEPALGRWHQGIVLESGTRTATVRIDAGTYTLEPAGFRWTGRTRPSSVVKAGDVAWFRLEVPTEKGKPKEGAEPRLYLEQEPRMEAAAVVLEHASGAVRAMVGGWDFERNKFNRVSQAKRQTGSAFKVFVYGAALENGWTPADTILDAPTVFIGADGRLSYRPQNYYRKYYGIVTLRRALELSLNVSAVKLLDLVGVRRVIDFARRCGVDQPLPPYPSLALGTADLTPLRFAAAYAALANQGTWIEPYMIRRISGPEGQVLEQHVPNTRTATDPAVAYVLTHMLEGVVDHGTATPVKHLPIDIAGKTGTTDDFSDAWFVGYTPRYTILTWIGYDVKKSLGGGMSGTVAALPMWRGIVEDGLATGWLTKNERFPVPAGVTTRDVEYYSGLLTAAGANRTQKEAFLAGTEPQREHGPQWNSILNLPWYQQKAFYLPKEGEEMQPAPEGPGAPAAGGPESEGAASAEGAVEEGETVPPVGGEEPPADQAAPPDEPPPPR